MTAGAERIITPEKKVLLVGPPAHDTISVISDSYINDKGKYEFDPGSKVRPASPKRPNVELYGGNIYNTVQHLARWKVLVTYAWNMGRDQEEVLDLLSELISIDTSLIGNEGWIGRSLVKVTESGQVDRLVDLLKSAKPLSGPFRQKVIESVGDHYATHVSSLADNKLLLDLVEEGLSKGTLMSISPGGSEMEDMPKLRQALQGTNMFAANKEEASRIFREALDGLDNPSPERVLRAYAEAAQNLMTLRSHDGSKYAVAIVTDGKKGMVAVDNEHVVTSGLYPESTQRPRISSLGTGDAVTSGMLFKMLLQVDKLKEQDDKSDRAEILRHAVHFANANATYVLGEFGASEGSFPADGVLHSMPIKVEER